MLVVLFASKKAPKGKGWEILKDFKVAFPLSEPNVTFRDTLSKVLDYVGNAEGFLLFTQDEEKVLCEKIAPFVPRGSMPAVSQFLANTVCNGYLHQADIAATATFFTLAKNDPQRREILEGMNKYPLCFHLNPKR